ncbi:MAG: hypothetical protein DI628_03140 [Blastochloris viridis]|uniref:Uncharacterized protein n=1 Tax=Blastochloris viridis TaxID=1079 RepID=A0A6N4R473_BLAVI|nr:MAG: hypothetical protein DI628_03140 [Blastochloris viridis]
MRSLLILAFALLSLPAMAQDNARAVREASLQASRYELLLGKLQTQVEDLQSQVRSLQRANDALAKDVQSSNAKSQNVTDEMQRLQNTQLQNINAAQKQLTEKLSNATSKTPWGDSQRDCAELGVKHQQIKVIVKGDGSRGMRFLCFDGKPLHMGSEIYAPAQ